ncbi:MAG: hypothetical protein C0504_03395 [Candidatus Solibacter sp.]|nr:hypothetical protein [Candidatus Solibacter sp.]
MFFKREQPKAPRIGEQIEQLSAAGFQTRSSHRGTVVLKGGFAALLRENAEGAAAVAESGLAVGEEIAVLTDLGFQKIFLTPHGRRMPALSEHLTGLHGFVESIQLALGQTRFYNDGLGTTNEKHIYDRVEGRDHGQPARPWEKTKV